MRKQLNRRRVKKRRRPNENSKMKFTVVLVIMIIAVALGYLTARFIIGPLLGYNTDESRIQIAGQQSVSDDTSDDSPKNSDDSEKTDDADETGDSSGGESSKETNSGEEDKDNLSPMPESGYALQFGVFSTKEAAQKMVNELAQKGVETKIIQDGENYKVISPIINTKDEAVGKIDEIKDKEVEDVFIASF